MISNIAIIVIYSNYIITIDILSYAREGIQRNKAKENTWDIKVVKVLYRYL